MAKGGARPGAGRKKGTVNKKTREVAERAALTGKTPIEVMIDAMRDAQDRGDLRAAANFAQMAAPYIHPRLSTVNANHNGQVAVTINVVSEFD